MSYYLLYAVLVPLFRLAWWVKTEDRENLHRHRGIILASNHASGADPLVVIASTFRKVHWMAKIEYYRARRKGWFFRAAGCIPVDRDAPAEQSFQSAARIVRRGGIFGIYPEGTRSPDGRLYRGHTGVARVAEMTGAPVVPTGVIGAADSLPKGKLIPRPKRVYVRYGEPMFFARLPGEDDKMALRRFTDDVMRAIAALTGQEYVDDMYSREARNELRAG